MKVSWADVVTIVLVVWGLACAGLVIAWWSWKRQGNRLDD